MPAPADPSPSLARPGLVRRLTAIVYDSFLLLALLFVATLVPLALNHGEAISGEQPLLHLLYQAYLLAVAFLFFGWFWTHGGQTLGMRAWRLRVIDRNGGNLGWGSALLRFVAALVSWLALGLGFWWVLLDPDKRAWHDIWSGTRMELVPKR